MALPDMLVQGVQTPNTLLDSYLERAAGYRKEQLAQRELEMRQQDLESQLKYRSAQMQNMQLEQGYKKEDRELEATKRQLWERWGSEADKITNPEERKAFYQRGLSLAMQGKDSQMVFAIQKAIDDLSPQGQGLSGAPNSFKEYLLAQQYPGYAASLEEKNRPPLTKPQVYSPGNAKYDFGSWVDKNLETKYRGEALGAAAAAVKSLQDRAYRAGETLDRNTAIEMVHGMLDSYSVENDILFGKNAFDTNKFLSDISNIPIAGVQQPPQDQVITPQGEQVALPKEAVDDEIPDWLVKTYRDNIPELAAESDGTIRKGILRKYGSGKAAIEDNSMYAPKESAAQPESAPSTIDTGSMSLQETRKHFDERFPTYSKWKRTLNPEETKQEIRNLLTPDYMSKLTPEQRKKANALLGTL